MPYVSSDPQEIISRKKTRGQETMTPKGKLAALRLDSRLLAREALQLRHLAESFSKRAADLQMQSDALLRRFEAASRATMRKRAKRKGR